MSNNFFGSLANLSHGSIRHRTHEPDYPNLLHKEYDWSRPVYAGAREEKPHDLPNPLGKSVTSTHYVHANLHHDLVTGKAVTPTLHFVSASPVQWYSKRQITVETATFGSEFVAAMTAVDQIIDHRTTFMYLGVPVNPQSFMFGDDNAVVDNASIPTSVYPRDHTRLLTTKYRKQFQLDI